MARGVVVIRQRLRGTAEAEAVLAGLKQSARNKLLRPGVGKAARLVARAAKAAAPKGPTGQLKRAVGSKVATTRKGTVVGLIGARTGYRVVDERGRAHDPAKVVHIVERGRKAVRAKPGKALLLRGVPGRGGGPAFRPKVGPAAGKRFLAAAWAQTESAARRLVYEGVLEYVRRGKAA